MTTLLLDTHVLVWAAVTPERLGPKARRAILGSQTSASAMSAHELARLAALGRLSFRTPLAVWLGKVQAQLGFRWISIGVTEAVESYSLPKFDHKDPCDRLIVATARIESSILVTADEVLLNYAKVQTLDARK